MDQDFSEGIGPARTPEFRMSKRSEAGSETSSRLAELALRRYHLPAETTAKLVSVSENEIYRLAAPDGRSWALRLQRPGYQSMESLASEIAWLVALRKEGVVATPVPCAGLDGAWVQSVRDPATEESRKLVLFVWEPGIEPTITMDLHPCFLDLGATIARMHKHSRSWQRPDGFTRFAWDVEAALGESARWGHWRDGLGMSAERITLFSRTVGVIRERLAAYGRGPQRFGLTHCDLRLANLLLDHGAVKVIDFDDCGFNWYMADLANCVSFYEHLPQVPEWIASLIEGYRTVNPVSRAEEDEIFTFLVLRRLLLVAWIGSHAETALAASMGVTFTDQTVGLCTRFLTLRG